MQRFHHDFNYHKVLIKGGRHAIALWFCLRLPSWGTGFESQAHHLCFFQFVLELWPEKNENKQKEAGIGPFIFKKGNKNRKVSLVNFF